MSHAVRCRTLAAGARHATLATMARAPQDHPFASLVAVAFDDAGRPLLFLSELAEHTKNLVERAEASLLVTTRPVGATDDPLASERMTLVGRCLRVPAGEVDRARAVFLAAHPEAAPWAALADFAPWRLEPASIRYVGGFGRMSFVDVDEYAAAGAATPADPLAGVLTLDDLEARAAERLPAAALGYYRSGADDETTLADNRAAFDRLAICYRVLVDVATRSLATTVLGTSVDLPVLVAPTAYHRLADRDGELATARAAAAAGTVFVVSTLATTSLEDVAAAATGPRWFQLYVHKDRGLTRALVARAEAAGYGALVVTVDTPVLGRRRADERSGFALPPGLEMSNLRDAGAGPVGGSALAGYVATRHDMSLSWRDLDELRTMTRLPLVLKGIVRSDDAARAAAEGVAGIVVSNHGGRQLDGAPATIDVLSEIADAVAGRSEVFLDGGVRRGTDVLRALALGARAVLLGRPILWGLATAGEAGVRRTLAIVADELSRAMALAGVTDVRAVPRDLVRPRGARA